jgi:pimeloyl-ACP methyl ester carboxylesterase
MPRYDGSDGSALHYDDLHGGGVSSEEEPVILLAGGAARHPEYLGDLAGLSERYRLIVPHLRGVGRTPMPDSDERGAFWSQADDLDCLRMHLGLRRMVLVAHSAGTRLSISYAAQHASGLAKMVLITPPATYLVDEASDIDIVSQRRHGDPDFAAAHAALVAGPGGSMDDDGFNAWHQASAPAGYASWGAKERAHSQIGRWNLAATKAYFSVMPPLDLATRLGEISAPVLVVAGADDCLTGVAPVTALADIFPAGASVVIENSGHYPWIEQPSAFREVVDRFLAP